MPRSVYDCCELCGRAKRLTFHHLIPKSLHSNKWFKKRFDRSRMAAGLMVCGDCHGAVHRFFTQKQLGRELNSREALLADPQIARFVRWVRKQNGARVRTRTSNDKQVAVQQSRS